MRAYIGFYWTLPVPWAGHQTLPQDVDAAAGKSLTIRYQRECVRQWVKENKGKLIEERVFMELAPDRGTEHIVPEVEKALRQCRETGAQLLVVDFSRSFGWRSHIHLAGVLRSSKDCILLSPVQTMINSAIFDPVAHFRKWRDVQDTFSSNKEEKMAQARSTVDALAPYHSNFASLAEALNAKGYKTSRGKMWTKENLRKFLKSG